MAYVIKEVNNISADRKPLTTVNGCLSQAKATATKQQMYKGTVMKIETTRGELVSYKKDGVWHDVTN